MKIKCERELLLENINLVQKAVSGRTSLPILECFLLTCDGNGLRMTSTDQEIGIKTEVISCEIIEEGSIAIPSKFFSDIIRKLPDGVVSIFEEKLIITIKCQNAEFKIVGRSADEFPELPEIESENVFKISQALLKTLIKQTSFSICQDESKPNLMGALVEISSEGLNMVTCDTFRVARRVCELPEGGKQGDSIIVPSKAIYETYKLLVNEDAIVSVYFGKKHVLFDLESCTLVSRLIDGEFLNYSNIFPEAFETKITVNKEMFGDALERACLISYYENKKNPVRMKIENSTLFITTAAETGNSSDEIAIELDGKELNIAFNPKFLLDVVKAIDEEEISIEFNTSLSPCVIKPVADKEECMYLVLPLRLK